LERHGIADALAISESPEVRLPAGGRLTIEATAALVAIDVDTGDGAAAADAPLRTDLEAAAEIGRQMRWRNLGGLILVDFVRLTDKGQRAKLEAALRRVVELDPVPVQLLGWTAGGLFEMIRPRARTPGAE
jgi:ribonuclease G